MGAGPFILVLAPLRSDAMARLPLRRLGAQTLVEHAVRTAVAAADHREHVELITDSDEVALTAERLGLRVHMHADPESIDAVRDALAERQGDLDPATVVVAMRAAAPMVRASDLRNIGTAASSGGWVSSADASGQRTEAVLGAPISRWLESTAQTGDSELVGIGDVAAFVIRTTHDWWIAERLFHRRRITVVVIGDSAVGLGHVYRASQLAHELADHDVSVVVPEPYVLAADLMADHGFRVVRSEMSTLADAVLSTTPDVVINDILNTDAHYVAHLKSAGVRVVNFEDLGPGALLADLVINDIFLETAAPPNHRNGPAYFCIRDEFLSATPRPDAAPLEEVLITFGGTDPADSTIRVAQAIGPDAMARGLRVSIVTGAGYQHLDRLKSELATWPSGRVELAAGTRRMSDYMSRADVAFSSAGRTVFELAAMRVPTIILAANEREETHTFASEANGFTYLGRADQVSNAEIVHAWQRIADDAAMRQLMRRRMGQWDFRDGRTRVMAELAPLLAAATMQQPQQDESDV